MESIAFRLGKTFAAWLDWWRTKGKGGGWRLLTGLASPLENRMDGSDYNINIFWGGMGVIQLVIYVLPGWVGAGKKFAWTEFIQNLNW